MQLLLSKDLFQRDRFMTPMYAMYVVIGMNVLKVATKLAFGFLLLVPAVWGDGLHNVSDIVEAGMVLYLLRSMLVPKEKYPNGQGNKESLMLFVQAILLFGVACAVTYKSVLGLRGETVLVEVHSTGIYIATAALYALSAASSFAVGRYQVRVGLLHNRPAVEGDGKETISDGLIELGVLAGIVSMIFFGNQIGGHVAGLGIAVKLVLTANEIRSKAVDALLQRSIGLEHDKNLATTFRAVPGVMAVLASKTWRVGGVVHVNMELAVAPHMSATSQEDLRLATIPLIRSYLEEHEMAECDPAVNFTPMEAETGRIGYVIRHDPHGGRVTAVEDATHLRVIDLERGKIVRIKDESLRGEVLTKLLRKKWILRLYGWLPEKDEPFTSELRCSYEKSLLPYAPSKKDR